MRNEKNIRIPDDLWFKFQEACLRLTKKSNKKVTLVKGMAIALKDFIAKY